MTEGRSVDHQAPPIPAAVLWDMDGTLVDTEPYWIETEYAMAARYGGTWTHADALSLVGNDLLELGRLHPRADGALAESRGDRRGAARRRGGPGPPGGAVAPRGRSSCWSGWTRPASGARW